MDVIYERCCGLDIHKRTVVACLIVPAPGGPPRKEVRTFGTMTDDLHALADWLAAAGCSHVAMESTGVYWQPIWNLLEGRFELLLVNAQHIKATSTDYPHRQHGLLGRDGQSHRPYASALRPDPPAG
jgi:transposase